MYRAPLREIRFVMDELLPGAELAAIYADVDYSGELAASVLEEAAKFGENVLEPLNRTGDEEGAHWTLQGVRMPKGFVDAYARYQEGGWPQLGLSAEHGGQGMPQVLGSAVEELLFSSNMGFYLCPSLTKGAVEAVSAAGSPELQAMLLPRLVTGEWTGTMNLTEAQAGSDLSLIRTRAAAEGDHYRVFGTKIFITFGDHDMTSNIAHLVLARIDGAPPGLAGISMFFVPKFLPKADGSPGEANDVRSLSIEHKLGIHASPTCVMAFGEKEGAKGWLVGKPNTGLATMFIMMNAARLSVGVQGLAQSERALQQALDWARSRLQGRVPGDPTPGPVPIIRHPDVRRMLLTMKAQTEAMRSLAYLAAYELDFAHRAPDEATRDAARVRAELLTPVVKGWCTENALRVASIGVQVHGGMGYVEETGAAQTLRDARITSIYEGTTAIQSNDLVGRKLARDGGTSFAAFIAHLRESLLTGDDPESARVVRDAALDALELLLQTSEALLAEHTQAPARALAVSVPFLELCGTVFGAVLHARAAAVAAAALAAGSAEQDFYLAKLDTARFYAQQILPNAVALATIVASGASSVTDADPSRW
jgi:alkylation response protein AidB-like acyl-CoA dehydrogenase